MTRPNVKWPDDPRHGVAAAVVVAEDLGEEAPDGGDRIEHPLAVPDAVPVEDVADAGFGQDLGKAEALVVCEAGAELRLRGRHGSCDVRGQGPDDDRAIILN